MVLISFRFQEVSSPESIFLTIGIAPLLTHRYMAFGIGENKELPDPLERDRQQQAGRQGIEGGAAGDLQPVLQTDKQQEIHNSIIENALTRAANSDRGK